MSLNKKSIYEQSFSRDMLLRTNKETVTSTPSINKIDINLKNGKSSLELQRYYDITSFSCLNTTFNLKVEVTSAGNIYIFDNKYLDM